MAGRLFNISKQKQQVNSRFNRVMHLNEIIGVRFADNGREYHSDMTTTDKVTDFLAKECRPWLDTVGSMAFYRGVSGSGDTPFTSDRDMNRTQTKYGSMIYPLFLNGLIVEKHGSLRGVAHRLNSRFLTSNMSMAAKFGTPYAFASVGMFHYTFNPLWIDWNLSVIKEWEASHIIDDYIDVYEYLDNVNTNGYNPEELNDLVIVRGLIGQRRHPYQDYLPIKHPIPEPLRHNIQDIQINTNIRGAHITGCELLLQAPMGIYVPAKMYKEAVTKLFGPEPQKQHSWDDI